MAVVVRCTGCDGLARVGPEAVGLLVVCPRCGDPFLADPVPEPAAPVLSPPAPPPPRPSRAEPVAPPRPRPRRRPPEPPPEEVHDHPPPSAGGVPFSVIIGLALLPLSIPLLWLIGPVAVGHTPALTLATPVSLAVSAAVLCLAVAYTVDWAPVTRIKGVLTLVGLAYFAGLSLYFLKQEAAEWAQQRLGADQEWHEFTPPGGGYEVRLPGEPTPTPAGPVPALKLTYFRASVKEFGRSVVFTVGAGPDHDRDAADGEWFTAVEQSLRDAGPGGVMLPGRALTDAVRLPNREWEAKLRKGAETRLVRVYRDRANGRVYLLSAEGPRLDAADDEARQFFGSFAVVGGKK